MTSTGQQYPQLTLFAEATHANHSALQDNETEQTTNGTYGQGSQTQFAHYDPGSHSWRTSQDTLVWDSGTYKQTWPRAGMTRNGTAYRQPPSAHRTYVTEYSSLLNGAPLWPTPTAIAWAATGQRANLQRKVETGILSEEEKRSMQAGNRGRTNPEWVEWLMGFPTGWTELEH